MDLSAGEADSAIIHPRTVLRGGRPVLIPIGLLPCDKIARARDPAGCSVRSVTRRGMGGHGVRESRAPTVSRRWAARGASWRSQALEPIEGP